MDVVTLPEHEQSCVVPAWLGLEQMGHCGHGGGVEGGSWGSPGGLSGEGEEQRG